MNSVIVQFYTNINDPVYTQYKKPWIFKHDAIADTSIKLAKHYAKKYNVKHELITEPRIKFKHPTYERFDLFYNNYWKDTYDLILYLDCDVFCYIDAPNIFDMYSSLDTFKVVRNSRKINIRPSNTFKTEYGQWKYKYAFNAGVFMLTKYAINTMAPFLNFRNRYLELTSHDNTEINLIAYDSKVNIEVMDDKFNYKNDPDVWFCHSLGGTKVRNKNHPAIVKARQQANEL